MAPPLNWITGLDQCLFRAINGLAGRNELLDWLARLGADDHIVMVVIAIALLSVPLLARDRPARERAFACLICAVLAVVLATAATYLSNALFFRPKPFTSQAAGLIFYRNTDSAFPSNAASLAFALSLSVLMFDRKVGAVTVALAAYIGLARIMVGVHYPFDIAAGALLGLGAALCARGMLPLYLGPARRLADLEYRFLSGWKPPGGARGGKGGSA